MATPGSGESGGSLQSYDPLAFYVNNVGDLDSEVCSCIE